jgi:hypothetical protein
MLPKNQIPKIIYLTKEGVLIECPHVPISQKEMEDEQAAEIVRTTHCKYCGYLRDAQLNNMTIACFHPSSQYLAQVKMQLNQKSGQAAIR